MLEMDGAKVLSSSPLNIDHERVVKGEWIRSISSVFSCKASRLMERAFSGRNHCIQGW